MNAGATLKARACVVERVILVLLVSILGLTLVGGAAKGSPSTEDAMSPRIVIETASHPQAISGGGPVDQACEVIIFFSATITDNCCIQTEGVTVSVEVTTGNATLDAPLINMTHSFAPPGFPEGQSVSIEGSVTACCLTSCPATVQVTIGAEDCAGNVAGPAIWTTEITDSSPPTILCPEDILGVGCGALIDPGTAMAADNCDPSPLITGTRSDGLGLAEPYPCGETSITWVAVDRCGNETSCVQSVRVFPEGASGGGGGGGGATTAFGSPVPNAGSDRDVCIGELVCLQGVAVDAEQGTEGLIYHWEFAMLTRVQGNPVYRIPDASQVMESLEGADTATPCFVPDLLGEYVLLLKVTDNQGHQMMDEITVTASECGEVFDCSYPDGWNLLSLPAPPVNGLTQSVFAGTTADGMALTYADGYEEAPHMGPLEGYWVHFLQADSLSVRGRRVQDDVTIHLENPGWHLISSPFSIDWERVLVFVEGAERFVGEGVARGVIDDFCACFDPIDRIYRISEELLPCQGYWIRTRQPDVVIKLEWTRLTAARPAAEGGCFSGEPTAIPPQTPEAVDREQASVLAYPNPIRHSVVKFEVAGLLNVREIRVGVYSSSGQLIWQGQGPGRRLEWIPLSAEGERLPWGAYIYCIDASVNGVWARTDCGILFLAEGD